MPLPNPSANPVGKRSDKSMYKSKYVVSILTLSILTLIPLNAKCEENDSDLFREHNNVVEVINYNENSINISDKDVYLIAQVVYSESKSEPYKGKVAVASVILNRLKSPNFPKTVKGVIKQKYAFSCVKDGCINSIPDEDSYRAVLDALRGNDPTSRAVFFYNPKIATSKWMINVDKKDISKIGQHVFFNVDKGKK